MNMRRSAVVAVVFLCLAVVSACGGTKRPPNVASGGVRGGAPAGRGAPSDAPRPVDSGPDLAPFDADSASSEDFSVSDPLTLEGGPLDDVLFGLDQAELSDQARATLEKHALWLQNHRAAQVTVEGHCDERGTAEYNLALGDQRARAARDYLVSLGVAADRLQTVSYGKERPLDPLNSEAAYSRNRRAHFVVRR
ncbi:MAG TPA: peptidoglycan-associated lipoprotein Pal [Vicinamibacteria bacterium]|nr:peptidoglycan-associated lipoprotein Pal [Vicinamibacteria bacterium]